jgi:O-antigen ligase
LKENLFYFRIEKILLIVFTIFIILYIHVLAVRSGVLAFYVSAFVLLVKHLIEVKYFKVLFAAIICFLIFPYIAYQLSPTFKTKYHYMKYDIEQYTSGNYNMVSSDIRRILSIRSGIDAAKENSTFGVGYGDIEQATFDSFDSKFPNAPKENRMLPHNQIIYTYTGLGWIGIVLFMTIFLIPLIYKKAWKNDLVLAIHIIVFSSFLSEYTFETQIGVAFYLLFLLLPLCQYWASLIPLKKQF